MSDRGWHRRGVVGWHRAMVEPTPIRRDRSAVVDVYETVLTSRLSKRPEPPEVGGPFVYFVMSPDKQAVKIGTAVNVRKRLAELQCGNYLDLLYIGAIFGGPAVERQLHQEFASARLSGEWFKPTKKVMRKINRLVRESVRDLRDLAESA